MFAGAWRGGGGRVDLSCARADGGLVAPGGGMGGIDVGGIGGRLAPRGPALRGGHAFVTAARSSRTHSIMAASCVGCGPLCPHPRTTRASAP
jgi:hypothetical protein